MAFQISNPKLQVEVWVTMFYMVLDLICVALETLLGGFAFWNRLSSILRK